MVVLSLPNDLSTFVYTHRLLVLSVSIDHREASFCNEECEIEIQNRYFCFCDIMAKCLGIIGHIC